jgi:hypothetical protein
LSKIFYKYFWRNTKAPDSEKLWGKTFFIWGI